MEIKTLTPEETMAFAKDYGQSLRPNTLLCFRGDLAAGKTTFVKGLVEGLAGISADEVSSPTFSYLNIYEGKVPVYHFDLYRLRDVEEFLSMGFDEYFTAGGVCCIEWTERIASLIPEEAMVITLKHLPEGGRSIHIEEIMH